MKCSELARFIESADATPRMVARLCLLAFSTEGTADEENDDASLYKAFEAGTLKFSSLSEQFGALQDEVRRLNPDAGTEATDAAARCIGTLLNIAENVVCGNDHPAENDN